LKVGPTSAGTFDARVRQLVEYLPGLTAIIRPLLEARAAIRSQFVVLHRLLLDLVRDDPVCRRFMTVPGVGAVVSITFQATVDIPQRFTSSKAVGAHFGLTPRAFNSGETDYTGRISRCGDALMRATLYEAAHTLLTHTQRWCSLKAWGVRVAQRRGLAKATVAVARKREKIRINSVHPGYADTPLTEQRFSDPAVRQALLDRTPMGRLGTALDIANGVLFLASDESSWVTGSELVIDGGMTAQ